MNARNRMRIFQLMTPLIYTFKNSEKYFQIFHKKIKLKIIIFKNSTFSFKGRFVPDIFAGATALKWFQTPSLLVFLPKWAKEPMCKFVQRSDIFYHYTPPLKNVKSPHEKICSPSYITIKETIHPILIIFHILILQCFDTLHEEGMVLI